MRRMIPSLIVLLPLMAHAQAGTSVASPVSLTAELTRPAAPATLAPDVAAPSHAPLRQFSRTQAADDFIVAAMSHAGTLEYAMMGDVPTDLSAPTLTRAVELALSDRELSTSPAVTNVVVRATVDAYGFPRNAVVMHSAGALVDQRALAAVSQYRFTPATRNNRAVEAPVTITITIKK